MLITIIEETSACFFITKEKLVEHYFHVHRLKRIITGIGKLRTSRLNMTCHNILSCPQTV